MKRMKRLAALLLTLCLLFTLLPTTTQAIIYSGTCGENLEWSLDNAAGTLTISGTGAMDNWGSITSNNRVPWLDYRYSFERVIISDGVTHIGDYAFNGCMLDSIKIAGSVTSIGRNAFSNCSVTTSITIPDSIISIGDCAFQGCSSLKSLVIPDSVTSIGDYAFQACSSLKNLIIPDNVISMGTGAFLDCYSLESVKIGKGITIFGDDAFRNCWRLTSATIESKTIGTSAFKECENLKNITFGSSVNTIGDSAFAGCSSLASITIPDNITSIGNGAFYQCFALKTAKIGNGVTIIGNDAFNWCENLTSVTIGNNVTIIGTKAFYDCGSLKNVTIGNRVATIGEYAFDNCYRLTHIKIPDSVFSIGRYAFNSCGLKSIAIGNNVNSIGEWAFYDCSGLSAVYYSGTEEDRNRITLDSYNYPLRDTQWHYQVTELDGVQPAYHCGECDKNYWWDGSESHFTDVLTNNWQFTHAKYAVDNNLMAGVGTDDYGRVTFLPDKAISREEFVQVLYNAEGKSPVSSTKVFPDVDDSGWYKSAVLWAFENNIASGLGDGNFGIGRNITRQDLALMLYKYAALCGCSQNAAAGSIFQYADGNNVASYAKTAMDWAVTNGILSGKGTAGEPIYTFRLDPTGTATRAECAAMLKNFMEAFGL